MIVLCLGDIAIPASEFSKQVVSKLLRTSPPRKISMMTALLLRGYSH
jgi:hypothetical protein